MSPDTSLDPVGVEGLLDCCWGSIEALMRFSKEMPVPVGEAELGGEPSTALYICFMSKAEPEGEACFGESLPEAVLLLLPEDLPLVEEVEVGDSIRAPLSPLSPLWPCWEWE